MRSLVSARPRCWASWLAPARLFPLMITGVLHAEGFIDRADHSVVFVQGIAQHGHVNVEAEIGVAGDLVEVVADAVHGSHKLREGGMFDGATATGTGTSFVEASSTGKCSECEASTGSPFLIPGVSFVGH